MLATDLTPEEVVDLVRRLPFRDAVKVVEEFGRMQLITGQAEQALDHYRRACVAAEAKPNA